MFGLDLKSLLVLARNHLLPLGVGAVVILVLLVLLLRRRAGTRKGPGEREKETTTGEGRFRAPKYAAFRNLTSEKKLAVIQKTAGVATSINFHFLQEVIEKEKDFVVKVAARRAVKDFEAKLGKLDRGRDVSGALGGTQILTVAYRGGKDQARLTKELVTAAEERRGSEPWKGPFNRSCRILNALREDTQEMVQSVVRGEKILLPSLCFYEDRLLSFVNGEKSLDHGRYQTLVSLVGVRNRLDRQSLSRPLLESIKDGAYLLVILTEDRVLLFVRGSLAGSRASWRQAPYSSISRVAQRSERGKSTLVLTVGAETMELPELRPDEARKAAAIIRRRSVESIRSDGKLIDVDIVRERKKLELLRKSGTVGESEYAYRSSRLQKMDHEKFSTENVERILAWRYKDAAVGDLLDTEMMKRFKSELTIMFTDIVGYSTKSAKLEMMDILSMLAIHDSLLLPPVKAHDGTLIKKIGDALMVSFDDPIEAVRCGLEMQEALAAFNRKHKDALLIRVGLNTGEVFIRDNDVYGDVVNTACRMEGFCEPGKILLAESTYRLVRDHFDCKSAGRRQLKDKRKVAVFTVA